MQIEGTLSTPRITVRNYQRADLPHLSAMWFDAENGKYLSDPTNEYVDDKYQAALDGLEDSSYGYYLTVVLNDSGEVIGSCFLFPDEKKERFDIGYCIHKNYWRQGYGTELLHLIVLWAREHGAVEITAEAAKENIASSLLLKKLGFEVVRESSFKKYNMNIEYESYIYRLTLK